MSVLHLTTTNFEQIITEKNIVVIDFWAEWCGPCKSFAPIFEQVAEQYPDITFAKVDIEKEQELANAFQIRSIPTLMIFKESIIIFSESGMLPATALQDLVNQAKVIDMTEVREQLAKDPEDNH